MRYFLAAFALGIILVISVFGFRGDVSRKPPIEVIPDMDRQPRLRPQKDTAFTAWEDGRSSRKPVEGTVARGSAYVVDETTTGMIPGTTNFVEVLPVAVNQKMLERGQHEFEIYCAPCHGKGGDGKGITSQFGMAAVANLHDPRIVGLPDGSIFNTITHGKNLMGGYGSNIEPQDRWAVVAYLRALQRSRLATIDDVPAHARDQLQQTK